MQKRNVLILSVSLAAIASAARAQGNDLDTAYKRELAFLEAEKNTLASRLAEVDRDRDQKVRAAQQEIERLQGRATGLALEADDIEDRLAQVEQTSAADAEGKDVVDGTLQQAEMALSKGGFKLPPSEGEPTAEQRTAQLDFVFSKSVALLDRYASVRKEPGAFFGLDGKKVQGSVVRVGQIAAYGVSEGAAGALAPAGEERLKQWPEGDSAAIARALVGGNLPSTLKLYLFESLEKEAEKPREKTLEDVMKAGGPIGYVIVVIGVLAALMAIARAVLLARAAANTEGLVNALAPLVRQQNLADALKKVQAAKGSAGRVLEATLKSLHRPREQLEDVISEAILREQPALDRFGAAILIAAAVGPLLGLLGTVTGMIATFDVITEYGNANPKLLAGGISEALVTTELGLMVAIPALLIGNLLSGWSQSIKDDIDKAALRVTNIFFGNDVSGVEEPSLGRPSTSQLAPAE